MCTTASNSSRWGGYERSGGVNLRDSDATGGAEPASVVGLLQDGRQSQLRGVGEQARRPRGSHTRSTGADVRRFERV